jgi:hypothetical protein
VASTSGSAGNIVQSQKQDINAVGGIALGAVGFAAAGYGLFEWRNEIAGAFGRLLALMGKK